MYAVIKTGGKQHRVVVDELLKVELLKAETGATIKFEDVLMIVDGETALVGSDKLAGKTVKAEIIGDAKGPKIRIIKYKNKTGYRKRLGHRQPLTVVEIKEIG